MSLLVVDDHQTIPLTHANCNRFLAIAEKVAILNALTFLLFALSLFAILGMQLYGGEFNFPPEDGGLPRANFDNFAVSWLSMFQVCYFSKFFFFFWLLG